MYSPSKSPILLTQKSDESAFSAEPSLMIVRMKGDKVVSEKMEYRSLLIARFHSSTPEESDAYEKMAGLLARALAFHTPSRVVTQWTLYSRCTYSCGDSFGISPNSLLNHCWYHFFFYILHIVFYININLTYCVLSFNSQNILELP